MSSVDTVVDVPGTRWGDGLVVVLGAASCLAAGSFVADFGPSRVYVANLALHMVISAGLAQRRRRVVASYVAVYAGLAGLSLLVLTSPVSLGVSPILLAAPISLYAISRHGPTPRWGVLALLLALVGSFGSPAARPPTPTAGPSVFVVSTMVLIHVLILVAVYLVAAERRRTEDDARAEAGRRLAAADRVAADRLRRAAIEERLQIAREVHDVVGHALSAVQVQAAMALALGGNDRFRAALDAIHGVAKGALNDTRSLVATLRSDDGTGPAGDLTVIPALVESARVGGLDITADLPDDLPGWQHRLGAPARLAILRAVQEGLTNAARHAHPRVAHLTLTVDSEQARLRLSNHTDSEPATGGYGLLGLTERVSRQGGWLSASRTPPDAADGVPALFALEVAVPLGVTVDRPADAQ